MPMNDPRGREYPEKILDFLGEHIDRKNLEMNYGFDLVPLLDDRASLLKNFLDGLESEVAHVRSNCASILCCVAKPEEVVEHLLGLLDIGHPDQLDAIRVASTLQLPIVGFLLKALRSSNINLQSAAAAELSNYPEDCSREALRLIVDRHHADPLTEERFGDQLDACGIERLRARVHFDQLAEAATRSLGIIGGPEDYERMLRLLVNGDPLVRVAAAEGLATRWDSVEVRDAIFVQSTRESPCRRNEMLFYVHLLDRKAALEEK